MNSLKIIQYHNLLMIMYYKLLASAKIVIESVTKIYASFSLNYDGALFLVF